MKMTFRWYGSSDLIPLRHIRQIPLMSGIVSAVYDVPVGNVWPMTAIDAIKESANAEGLAFDVVESVPVHEDIKMGKATRDHYIDNYLETIQRLAEAGVKVICYNFMPVFDWLRSDLKRKLADGSTALAYDNETVLSLNPATSELSLPGWDESYDKEQLRALLAEYAEINEEKLWENYAYFINRITPLCEELDIKMGIHPDDPPWGIFGLPRIITGEQSYARMVEINPSPANGITLCFGSLGANPDNDLPAIVRKYVDRIYFVHARNVKRVGKRSFEEAAHPSACGNLNMVEVLRALYDGGFDGYIRPDHGRMIWGEVGRPGYGLFDRALGATYIQGVWDSFAEETRILEEHVSVELAAY